jgi:predicted CopG family antitoxin
MTAPAYAQAITSIVHVIVPLESFTTNFCNGEAVVLSGNLNIVEHLTEDASGGFHIVRGHTNFQGVAGVDESGDKYIFAHAGSPIFNIRQDSAHPLYMLACNNYFEKQNVETVITTSSSKTRRNLKLKRIVVSEHNYLALKRLGHAGDSFNDVISKLLRMYWNHQQKQQQQQDTKKSDSSTMNGKDVFPRNLFELLQLDSEQLADVIGSRTRNNRNEQTSNKVV